MSRPISRAPRQRFSGRLLGERSGSWWKTIRVQSAYRPAVLEWEHRTLGRLSNQAFFAEALLIFMECCLGFFMVGDRLSRLPHSESFSLSSRQARIGAFSRRSFPLCLWHSLQARA